MQGGDLWEFDFKLEEFAECWTQGLGDVTALFIENLLAHADNEVGVSKATGIGGVKVEGLEKGALVKKRKDALSIQSTQLQRSAVLTHA